MINIVEILKDCPKGTKLYSPICGNCKLLKIYNGLGLDVINDVDEVFNFSYDGRYNLNGECCIFPSKDNRDWNTFRPFKDGDILTYTGNYTTTFIYRYKDNEPHLSTSFYVACNDAPSHNFLIYNKYTLIALNENCDVCLATEDEKIKLFDAIKANGYKWNAETKTLEKLIEPKFKVGDKIKEKNERFPSTRTIDNYVEGIGYYTTINDWVRIEDQDNWESVPTHKFKVGDKIVEKDNPFKYWYVQGIDTYCNSDYFYYIVAKGKIANLHFKDQNEWELVPNKFDISTLKAYDKVLVRDTDEQVWVADLFSHVLDRPLGGYTFACVGHYPNQCIPYLGNEHLLGTNNDCDEYFKNW